MPLALDTSPQTEQDRFSFFSRPNCSLTRTERDRVFWGIATVTLLVASVFSWLGYWLLAWAFAALGSNAGDYESIRIRGDEILIERRHGGHLESRTLNGKWVKLVLVGARPGGKVKLALRSCGRETELGAYLTDEARLELAKALQTRINAG